MLVECLVKILNVMIHSKGRQHVCNVSMKPCDDCITRGELVVLFITDYKLASLASRVLEVAIVSKQYKEKYNVSLTLRYAKVESKPLENWLAQLFAWFEALHGCYDVEHSTCQEFASPERNMMGLKSNANVTVENQCHSGRVLTSVFLLLLHMVESNLDTV